MIMIKKGLLAGTISAVAITTLLVGGATVLAANNENTASTEDAYEYEEYYYDDWCYDVDDIDYGDLSEGEIERLNAIYDRLWEIEDEIYGEDEELTYEEYMNRFAKYEAEYNQLDSEAIDLEIKAGWYGDLNKDEVNRLFALYDEVAALEERAGFYEDFTDFEW